MSRKQGYEDEDSYPHPCILAQDALDHIRRRSERFFHGEDTQAQADIERLLEHIDALEVKIEELMGKRIDWMGDGDD